MHKNETFHFIMKKQKFRCFALLKIGYVLNKYFFFYF